MSSITQQQNAEEVTRLASTNARICALHTKGCRDMSTRARTHTHRNPLRTHQMRWPDSVRGKRSVLRAASGLSDKVRKAPRGYTRSSSALLVLCPLLSLPSNLLRPAIHPRLADSPPPSPLLSKHISVSLHYRSSGQGLLHRLGGMYARCVSLCVVAVRKQWGMLGRQRDLVRGQVPGAVCIS